MALTHSESARNAATDAVLGLIGVGGRLVFRVAGNLSAPGAEVASLELSARAFSAASKGVARANEITPDIKAVGNSAPVETATIETSRGVVVIHCKVAASGADINLKNGLVVSEGDTVKVTSLSYQAIPE